MKLKGLTQAAYSYLTIEDIQQLEEMIGCEVEYSVTNKEMLIMPDGELTHERFLIL